MTLRWRDSNVETSSVDAIRMQVIEGETRVNSTETVLSLIPSSGVLAKWSAFIEVSAIGGSQDQFVFCYAESNPIRKHFSPEGRDERVRNSLEALEGFNVMTSLDDSLFEEIANDPDLAFD